MINRARLGGLNGLIVTNLAQSVHDDQWLLGLLLQDGLVHEEQGARIGYHRQGITRSKIVVNLRCTACSRIIPVDGRSLLFLVWKRVKKRRKGVELRWNGQDVGEVAREAERRRPV